MHQERHNYRGYIILIDRIAPNGSITAIRIEGSTRMFNNIEQAKHAIDRHITPPDPEPPSMGMGM